MTRAKRTRPQLSFEAESKELYMRFDKLIKKKGLTKTFIFNEAMRRVVDEHSFGGVRKSHSRSNAGGVTNSKRDKNAKNHDKDAGSWR